MDGFERIKMDDSGVLHCMAIHIRILMGGQHHPQMVCVCTNWMYHIIQIMHVEDMGEIVEECKNM